MPPKSPCSWDCTTLRAGRVLLEAASAIQRFALDGMSRCASQKESCGLPHHKRSGRNRYSALEHPGGVVVRSVAQEMVKRQRPRHINKCLLPVMRVVERKTTFAGIASAHNC